MSAKSIRKFTVICGMDELQNPLPRKAMLFEGHMTSTNGTSNAFPNSYGPWLLIKHCIRGKGFIFSLMPGKQDGGGRFLNLYGRFKYFWQTWQLDTDGKAGKGYLERALLGLKEVLLLSVRQTLGAGPF